MHTARFTYEKTKKALLWMSLSNEPFVVLYALIPFIIRKELGVSLLQLSLLASLRPVLSIFSFYWSANLTVQRHRLRHNLISAWLFARLPFLFVPWIESSWYLIFCCAGYELLNKSGNPALMEILKTNLEKEKREKIYTLCFVLGFLEGILLGFLIGNLLNQQFFPWQGLFAITAIISLSSIFVQIQIPLPPIQPIRPPNRSSLIVTILSPWQEAFSLLKMNPDFLRFQYGFMIGGIGLMLATPSLSLFCVDYLHLTHQEITVGRSILMGLGVSGSSYLWRRMLSQQNADQLLSNILIGFSLYLTCLYLAVFHLYFFYIAHILYGLSQAGSHLLWNLSGPLFSGHEESSQYSRVNILMVGLRGAIAPAVGGALCSLLGPAPIILISAAICLTGAFYMFKTKKTIATNDRHQDLRPDH